ncbi:MAG: DNA-processing protein DprA [Clostridia bacterium]|nr:DNA-processing protein DprA [Clostridia bacterium]
MRYQREDGCRAWLTSTMIRPETLCTLMREAGSAESVYIRFLEDRGESLREWLTERQLNILRKASAPDAMHRMMLRMQELEIGILSIDDPFYPAALTEINSAPALLFYRGSLSALQERSLTIVGTRKATPSCAAETESLAKALSKSGVCVVSGLAVGIDGAAHEGCLQGGSPTIGVCGCGIDIDYPSDNSQLRERILSGGGLLLSEFPLGMKPTPWSFSSRNRILSGLSRAVVMMQGYIKSGAMVTVGYALDQGREVFAYPGIPNLPLSEGPHQLLREGARYFTTAADILEDLGWDEHPLPTREQREQLPELTPEQKKVYSALSGGELSMDEIAEATGLSASEISVALTMLQMMGRVKSLPGKYFARI